MKNILYVVVGLVAFVVGAVASAPLMSYMQGGESACQARSAGGASFECGASVTTVVTPYVLTENNSADFKEFAQQKKGGQELYMVIPVQHSGAFDQDAADMTGSLLAGNYIYVELSDPEKVRDTATLPRGFSDMSTKYATSTITIGGHPAVMQIQFKYRDVVHGEISCPHTAYLVDVPNDKGQIVARFRREENMCNSRLSESWKRLLQSTVIPEPWFK